MADPRESFPILENASGEGVVVREIISGDSTADKRGLLGFSFRDSNDNAVLPKLTSDGRLPVTSDAAGNPLKSRGEVPAGSASGSFVTVASITINNNGVYNKFSGNVSCRRAALFQLVHMDDAVANVLADFLVDAGQYSVPVQETTMEVTGGASGAQTIIMRAFNLDNGAGALANLRANINCVEIIS